MSGPEPASPGPGPDLAMFLPFLAGGGAERVVLDLAIALAQRGVRVELVLARRQGPYLADVPPEITVVDLRSSRVATSALPLIRYLRRRRPKGLLSTLEHANVLALLARRFAPGVRVVVREANTPSVDVKTDTLAGRVLRWLMQRTYRTADAVVAVSQGVADELVALLGVAPERVHVIDNPVLTPRVREGALAALEHPWFAEGQPPVVVGAGRLAPQKGFTTLVRAFAEARARTPCRLMVLGEGEQRAELEALAEAVGMKDEVAFPGFVPNPFPYMAAAGAFVLSSAWEGLPNVLIQAVALGTPVVSTDCPNGPREILDRGALGRLVPVGDVAAMGDAIVAALAQPRSAPSAAWLQRYDRDAVAERYGRVLGIAL